MTDKESQLQKENLLISIKELNNLMMSNVQKLMKINIDLVENYTQISIDNYKTATDIKSVDELIEYAQKQREIAQEVGNKIAQDARTVIEMSDQYLARSKRLAEEAVASIIPLSTHGIKIYRKNTDLLMNMFKPTHAAAPQSASQDDKAPEDVQ